jgi:hypothetical protein
MQIYNRSKKKVTPVETADWYGRTIHNYFGPDDPKFSETYVISGLHLGPGEWKDEIYISLVGYSPKAYWYRAFKPVQSTETGMAILRGLLKTRQREFEPV